MFDFITRRFQPLQEYRVVYHDINAHFYLSTIIEARSQYEASRIFDRDRKFLYCVRIFTQPVVQ